MAATSHLAYFRRAEVFRDPRPVGVAITYFIRGEALRSIASDPVSITSDPLTTTGVLGTVSVTFAATFGVTPLSGPGAIASGSAVVMSITVVASALSASGVLTNATEYIALVFDFDPRAAVLITSTSNPFDCDPRDAILVS